MHTYLVERDLAGTETASLYQMAAALHRGSAQLRSVGEKVYYLGSTFRPEDQRCFCLFEARDAMAVSRLCRRSGQPFLRVSPALSFAAPPVLVT